VIDNTAQSTNKSVRPDEKEMPDLWEGSPQSQQQAVRPVPVVPLDTTHEITAAPAPDGILSPAGDPNALQIPAHTSEPAAADGAGILLQEEIKVKATQAKSLWNHIRDFLALWWWAGPRDEQSS
jgi:hypothetical protein